METPNAALGSKLWHSELPGMSGFLSFRIKPINYCSRLSLVDAWHGRPHGRHSGEARPGYSLWYVLVSINLISDCNLVVSNHATVIIELEYSCERHSVPDIWSL
jgi:hypothetical protein